MFNKMEIHYKILQIQVNTCSIFTLELVTFATSRLATSALAH